MFSISANNILNLDLVLYTVGNIIGYSKLIFILIIFILSFFIVKKINLNVSKLISKLSLVILIFIVLLSGSLNDWDVSNPYVDSISSLFLKTEYGKVNHNFDIDFKMDYYNSSLKSYSGHNLTDYKKIFIFVMEQTSLDDFNREMNDFENKSFFEEVRNNTHFFSNYYTNNQDSRTTVWTLLNSIQIPFESYTNNWNKKYGVIVNESNLVDFFNYNNYTTLVSAAQYEPSLLLSIHNWSDFIYLKSYDEVKNSYVCVSELKYQKGCEDNAIFDDVVEKIDNYENESLFFLQEFIFGHGGTYMDTLNLERSEYYSLYLSKFYDFLKTKSYFNDSLIVVVSDHGGKGTYLKSISDYHLPLFVISPKLKRYEIDSFYSTLDIKDIILSYLENESLPNERNSTFIVGQTSSNEFAFIDKDGNYFLSKYFDKYSKVHELKGIDLSQLPEKLGAFRSYKNYIGKLSREKYYHCHNCEYVSEKIYASRND